MEEQLLEILYNILPIFIMAAIGFFIRRKWLINDDFWRGLEKMAFYILFPCLIFYHVTVNGDMSAFFNINSYKICIIVTLVIFVMTAFLLFIKYIFSFDDNAAITSVFQGVCRYNGYIFFAVTAVILKEEGLQILASVSPYLIIFTNIVAILCFAIFIKNEDNNELSFVSKIFYSIKKISKVISTNPLVIASLIGLIINYYNVILYSPVENTIFSIANTAVPIGMIIVGASLHLDVDFASFKLIMLTSLSKFIIYPIMAYIMVYLFDLQGIYKMIVMLISVMPCSSSSYMLAREMGGDFKLMTNLITVTTILSLPAITIILLFL